MYESCKEKFEGITFFYVDHNELCVTRNMLEKRFENTCADPGTRSFHFYEPVNNRAVRVKRCSDDEDFFLTHDPLGYNPSTEFGLITAFNHVSCLYEGKWWIGVVTEVNHEEDDVSVKFMHPMGQQDHSTGQILMISAGCQRLTLYAKLTFQKLSQGGNITLVKMIMQTLLKPFRNLNDEFK